MMTPVTIEELKRAWQAVEAGQFRADASLDLDSSTWRPVEPAIGVVGARGQVGATTTALAMATAMEGPARLIECAPAYASGLLMASAAELGVNAAGWRCASRGPVQLERADPARTVGRRAEVVTPPADSAATASIVDLARDARQIRSGWMAEVLDEAPLVVVGVASIPGLQAVESLLATMVRPDRLWCALRGAPRRKWPRASRQIPTPRLDAVDSAGRLLAVPFLRDLAEAGLTAEPLPGRLVTVFEPVARWLLGESAGGSDEAA